MLYLGIFILDRINKPLRLVVYCDSFIVEKYKRWRFFVETLTIFAVLNFQCDQICYLWRATSMVLEIINGHTDKKKFTFLRFLTYTAKHWLRVQPAFESFGHFRFNTCYHLFVSHLWTKRWKKEDKVRKWAKNVYFDFAPKC